MKKALVLGLAAAALLTLLPAPAAAGPTDFYARYGILTDKNFSFSPLLWMLGVNLDFNLGPALFVAGEADVIVHKFTFNPVWVTPAVTLNLRMSNVFIGAGVAKMIIGGSGYTLTSDMLLKFNAGLKTESLKLQVFAYTTFEDILGADTWVGLTMGFGF